MVAPRRKLKGTWVKKSFVENNDGLHPLETLTNDRSGALVLFLHPAVF